MPDIELAADFWDCECSDGFIHRTGVHDCPRCGAVQDDQPSSRVSEVANLLGISVAEIRRVA